MHLNLRCGLACAVEGKDGVLVCSRLGILCSNPFEVQCTIGCERIRVLPDVRNGKVGEGLQPGLHVLARCVAGVLEKHIKVRCSQKVKP